MTVRAIILSFYLGVALVIILLGGISYYENKAFCEFDLPNCADPWLPFWNM